jgi:hypothetical protein
MASTSIPARGIELLRSVRTLMPSRRAASVRLARQVRKVRRMSSRSMPASVVSAGCARGVSISSSRKKSRTSRVSPWRLRTTARSQTFCSWRTFPDQARCSSAANASAVTCSGARRFSSQERATKCCTR